MKNIATIIVLTVLVFGCGLFTSKQVIPKEQIDADIAKQDVKTGTDSNWLFLSDDARCFEVVEKDASYTETEAKIPVIIASWFEMTLSDGKRVYPSVMGRMRLDYKKEGDKWVLEKVDSPILIKKFLDEDGFREFLNIQTPLCKYHRFAKSAK